MLFQKGVSPLPLGTQGKWLNLWDLCDLLWIDVSCLLLVPPFFKAADLMPWFFHLQLSSPPSLPGSVRENRDLMAPGVNSSGKAPRVYIAEIMNPCTCRSLTVM